MKKANQTPDMMVIEQIVNAIPSMKLFPSGCENHEVKAVATVCGYRFNVDADLETFDREYRSIFDAACEGTDVVYSVYQS